MSTTLLVDLGGTRLKAALLPGGSAVPTDVIALPHGGEWQPAVMSVAQTLGADEIALCVPGLVDRGRVVSLPGKLPGIERADLAAALGLPVPLVVNDAVAYAVGEAGRGAGRGHSRVVAVTLGTGVGVAVVEDGRPLGGGPLGGGLLGGQLVLGAADGPSDTSGRRGTFEARCRADSLVAAVPGASDVADAFLRMRAGEPAALQGFSAYREWLVRGLVALCLAHAPDCVVVGGGAAQAGLLDGVQESVDAGLWRGQRVVVRPAELGDAAALAGLGLLLRARVDA